MHPSGNVERVRIVTLKYKKVYLSYMGAKQIRINQNTLDEIREISQTLGDTTDDVTIRLILAEYRRLNTETELLSMKLRDCMAEYRQLRTETELLRMKSKESEETFLDSAMLE